MEAKDLADQRKKMEKMKRLEVARRKMLELNQVEDNLYISSIVPARNTSLLERFHITHIVDISNVDLGKELCNDRKYFIIKLTDDELAPIQDYFEQVCDWIDKATKQGDRVLVHCVAGCSRSAALVMAYLIKKYQITVNEALQRLCQKRPVVGPNDGFIKQLHEFADKYSIQASPDYQGL